MKTGSFLGAWNKYAGGLTDAPREYIDALGLSLLSLAVGRTPIRLSPNDCYPHLWVLIIGTSGISRKSSVMDLAKNVLPSESTILANQYTKESLVEELSRTPQGVSFWDECGGLLKEYKNSRGYMSGVDDVLCSLYSLKDKFVRHLKSGTYTLENVCFNLVWATTPSKFFSNVELGDIGSGFLARFLIIAAEKDPTKTLILRNISGTDTENKKDASEKLQSVWQAFHIKPKAFVFEEKALQRLNEFQLAKEREVSEVVDEGEKDARGALAARLGEHMRKISALYKVDSLLSQGALDSTETIEIDIDSVTKAETYCESLNELNLKLSDRLGETWITREIRKLETFLVKKGGSASRTAILQGLHLSSSQFDEILKTAIAWKKVVANTLGSSQMVELTEVPDGMTIAKKAAKVVNMSGF